MNGYPLSEKLTLEGLRTYPAATADATATAKSAVTRDFWSSSHAQNTIVASTIPSTMNLKGDHEGKEEKSPADDKSIYTSDIPEFLAYAKELATNFFKNSELLPDNNSLKKIYKVLPDLLRGFALRIGTERQDSDHFRIMRVILGIRE